ncbi:hypothetical protein ES332_A07G227200v1 [Gossypium tomentosum]|uniref:Uncharacterized protein n=1 Tax=Gossypium tomentosum TaxID=34277 RepID=A0A5D2PZ13_GOSTO|nr:hypothetical protein ES332_A07G227200v1 [Gossypium tomentosum]
MHSVLTETTGMIFIKHFNNIKNLVCLSSTCWSLRPDLPTKNQSPSQKQNHYQNSPESPSRLAQTRA